MEECCHIRVNGTKCGSVALRGELWCYYHHALFPEAAHRRRQVLGYDRTRELVGEDSPTRLYGENHLDLPHIEDSSSIQLAIARVVAALAANALDHKTARLILYGLQIATRNLPKIPLTVRDTVREIGVTDDGVELATAIPIGEKQPETLGMLLMAEVKRREDKIAAEQEEFYYRAVAENEARDNAADPAGEDDRRKKRALAEQEWREDQESAGEEAWHRQDHFNPSTRKADGQRKGEASRADHASRSDEVPLDEADDSIEDDAPSPLASIFRGIPFPRPQRDLPFYAKGEHPANAPSQAPAAPKPRRLWPEPDHQFGP